MRDGQLDVARRSFEAVLHGIEPWAYLRDLFCLLPSWPQTRVLELAPAYWRETLKQEDTQQRLAADIYRSVTLEHSPPE